MHNMNESITVQKNGVMIIVEKLKGEMNKDLYDRAWFMLDKINTMSYNEALVLANMYIHKKKGCVY